MDVVKLFDSLEGFLHDLPCFGLTSEWKNEYTKVVVHGLTFMEVRRKIRQFQSVCLDKKDKARKVRLEFEPLAIFEHQYLKDLRAWPRELRFLHANFSQHGQVRKLAGCLLANIDRYISQFKKGVYLPEGYEIFENEKFGGEPCFSLKLDSNNRLIYRYDEAEKRVYILSLLFSYELYPGNADYVLRVLYDTYEPSLFLLYEPNMASLILKYDNAYN